MRYFSCVAVAAGLLFCLTATPARADLAAPEAGSAETGEILSALQALTGLADAASELSPTSAYASAVKTTGPAGVALGGEGVDSSYGPVDTWSSYGSGFASTESNGAGGAALPASAPSGVQGGGHLVGSNATVAAYDLSTLASSPSAPVLLASQEGATEPNPPAVPIPASVLLLGGGLLGLYPLRRSTGCSVGA